MPVVSSFRLHPSYLLPILLVFITFVSTVFAQDMLRTSPSSPGLASWPVQLAAKEGLFALKG